MTKSNSTIDNINKARALILTSPRSQIDLILTTLGVTHEEYRQHYPDTPVTVALALDIMDAKDLDGMTNENIRRKWNLSKSQLNYALYNDKAITSRDSSLPRLRVESALKNAWNGSVPAKSQTEIADENGVSQSYVHKIAKELGLLPTRKKRVSLTQEQWSTIFTAVDNGTPIEHLAKQYGVSRDTIYKKLRTKGSQEEF